MERTKALLHSVHPNAWFRHLAHAPYALTKRHMHALWSVGALHPSIAQQSSGLLRSRNDIAPVTLALLLFYHNREVVVYRPDPVKWNLNDTMPTKRYDKSVSTTCLNRTIIRSEAERAKFRWVLGLDSAPSVHHGF